jgi:predicted DNA-binding transcriptional regulator AlpA
MSFVADSNPSAIYPEGESVPSTPADAEFLTIPQAAAVLQVHAKTAYDWALKQKLPGAFRLPAGPWRVSRSALLRYARENRVLSPGETER